MDSCLLVALHAPWEGSPIQFDLMTLVMKRTENKYTIDVKSRVIYLNSTETRTGQISLTFVGDVGPFPFEQVNYDLFSVAIGVVVSQAQSS